MDYAFEVGHILRKTFNVVSACEATEKIVLSQEYDGMDRKTRANKPIVLRNVR